MTKILLPKIVVGCDHAGFHLKTHLVERLLEESFLVDDCGCHTAEVLVDYPDYADKVVKALLSADPPCFGILICGTGQGMAIRANRYRGVRAALAWNREVATLARAHNQANVLCLGGRLLSPSEAWEITKVFLSTEFEGDRHEKRVQKLDRDTGGE